MRNNIRKLRQSFHCAFHGIMLCIRSERNYRIHICTMCYVLAFAWIAGLTYLEYVLLFFCIALVIGMEMVNTAIEYLCDAVSDKYEKHLGAAKDIGAGAVLVAALFAVFTAAVVFLRPESLLRIRAFFSEELWTPLLLIFSVPAAILFIGKHHSKQ